MAKIGCGNCNDFFNAEELRILSGAISPYINQLSYICPKCENVLFITEENRSNFIFLDPSIKFAQKYALDELLEMISNKSILRAAVAYLTHPEICSALAKRVESGLYTYLIINSTDILRPRNPEETEIVIAKPLLEILNLQRGDHNFFVRVLGMSTKKKYQNMHHKFAVSNTKVIFGSLNWTVSALNYNYEVISISEDNSIINQFIDEFNRLWEQGTEIFTNDKGFRSIKCPICDSWGIDLESYGPFCTYCFHKFKVV